MLAAEKNTRFDVGELEHPAWKNTNFLDLAFREKPIPDSCAWGSCQFVDWQHEPENRTGLKSWHHPLQKRGGLFPLKRGICQDHRGGARFISEGCAPEHVCSLQHPTVFVRNVSEGERESGNFQSERVAIVPSQTITQEVVPTLLIIGNTRGEHITHEA